MDIKTQIKNNLISRIKSSNDLNFLKALQTIFDSSEQSLYQLSSEQQDAIKKGREEIRDGSFIENERLMSEMKEWLSKE
jgi:predicted transcriptional regulator